MNVAERAEMGLLEYEQAIAYAIRRLEAELDPILTYHSAAHTRDDVMLAVERLAEANNIGGEELILLRTAVAFHDLGFVEQRDGRNHESRSVEIARQMLPDYGYSDEQLDIISGLIMATRMPQQPTNLLEEIMVDADLDNLGRSDYFIVSNRLRRELENFGIVQSDTDWYQGQLHFLSNHEYFTESAHHLRSDGKVRNIVAVQEILSRILDQ